MIPVFNVYGHITRSRYLTEELDKAFPGKEKGSVASRFAHTFILSKADIFENGGYKSHASNIAVPIFS